MDLAAAPAVTGTTAGDRPEIDTPAQPILKGVGLDQPFFDDKNRAFWVLQSIGWVGYFILRSLSGLANAMGAIFIVHTLLLTATGYSLTLLMGSLFRRLITLRAGLTLILSLIAVMLASAAFSVIETWSYATFIRPGSKPVGVEFFGAILLDFALLTAWSALYYGINYYILLEEQIDQHAKLESQASSAPAGDAALSVEPAFPVQYIEFDLDPGAAEADRAGQCDAGAIVVVPALYAGQ